MKRTLFTDGWEFSRDDESFEPVVVPHDAMLGNKRSADAVGGAASGYFHGARYRYRKTFSLDADQAQHVLLLEFGGVYRNAEIVVNGTSVPAAPYGFIPFFADLTGLVQAGENTIEVSASNADQPDCRWYSGGGMYRPVWLWEGGAARIEPEGVRVTTLSVNPARVRVDVRCTGGAPYAQLLDAQGDTVAEGLLSLTAVGEKPLVAGTAHLEGRADSCNLWSAEFGIPNASLWSAETPNLYTCRVDLLPESDENATEQPGRFASSLDSHEVRFGIRKLEWEPQGFFVNGHETLLQGGCIHADNGIVGTAAWPEAERRRVALLKQAGFNALRMAHHPASESLLEACDELGMYVMDETWDMWFMRKSAHDYAREFLDWCDFDLRRLASRDYNHPSVVMYSIGNEIADPIVPEGVEIEQSMVALLHSLDPTRPVTCGFNLTMMVMERIGRGWYAQEDGVAGDAPGTGENPRGSLLFNLSAQVTGKGMTLLANMPGADALVSPALDALDIAGYNYATARYEVDARKHPDRLVVGSETFPQDLPASWEKVRGIPTLIGDFQWAAWDYLGEAGANAWAYTPEEAGFVKPWPWMLAGSGCFDALGQPNAQGALSSAVWEALDGPSIQVRPVNRMNGPTYRATWRGTDAVPCWSWRSCDGTPTTVEVYDAHAAMVRLELNGRSLGTKRVRRFKAEFDVEYEPGVLAAVSLDEQGRELGRNSLVSAAGPLKLAAAIEAPTPAAGGIALVTAQIVGENGQVEANADRLVTATAEGCKLLGFGSAATATDESYLDGRFTTYRGRTMAAFYRETPGEGIVTFESEGLGAVSVAVNWA